MTDYIKIDYTKKAYGYILKKSRENQGFTQEKLSNLCYIHRNKISEAENGKRKLNST